MSAAGRPCRSRHKNTLQYPTPGTGANSSRLLRKRFFTIITKGTMLEIKINVEVDLSERAATLLRLKQPEDLPAAECNCTAADKDPKDFIKETVYEFLRDLQEHAKKPVEEPKPETAQSPVREEKAPQAAPETTAQAETEEITDAALRKAVKAAKDKVGTPVVKALFAEFEIPNSSACPQERRGELMDRLEKLAA